MRDRWVLSGPLGRRLFAAFVLVALSSVTVLTIAAMIGTDRGLDSARRAERELVADRVVAEVGRAYAAVGGWEEADLGAAQAVAEAAGVRLVVRDATGAMVWPGPGRGPGMGGMHAAGTTGAVVELAVTVAGRTAGSVRLAFPDGADGGRGVAWSWVLGAAVVALVTALAVSGFVVRRLTRPLMALAQAARRLAAGDRVARVRVDAPGELGEVARAFDAMADEVVRAETVRRRLAADVAHELRTPLAGLQAGLEELRDGLREPDVPRLTALHDQTLRLGRVVQDLADLSAAESAALSLRPVGCDLADIARAAVAAQRPQLDAAGLHLETDLATAVPVRVDPDRIHQALVNLLANAVRYCRPGDRVTVGVRSVTARRRSPSPTPGRGSRPTTCRTSSTGCGGAATPRRSPVPASGWRSSASSSPPTAVRSPRRRHPVAARRSCSGYPGRSEAGSDPGLSALGRPAVLNTLGGIKGVVVMKRLLVLGAGTAGTMVVNRLRRRLRQREWRITVVDESDQHFYQPGYLFIPFGTYAPADVVKPRRRSIHAGVDLVRATVDRVDAEANTVLLTDGRSLPYDYLVIATGVTPRPDQTPGMLDGGEWRRSIFDFYTHDGAVALADALKTFDGGRLVVHIVDMPIKCPVAPLEFTFLADAYLRERGLRDRVELVYATPLPAAFTKPIAARHLGAMLDDRRIALEADFLVERIEGKTLVSYDEREIGFDLLVTVPLNMGADYVARSGLGDELNLVPVDRHTLLSKAHRNIFAIGDANDAPASKAGSVAHFAVDVFTGNFLRHIAGLPMTARFDGHANCFVESGAGRALLIDFNYDTEPLPGRYPVPGIGPFSLLKETAVNHWGKLAFRPVYWHALLPGRPVPLPAHMSMAGKHQPSTKE